MFSCKGTVHASGCTEMLEFGAGVSWPVFPAAHYFSAHRASMHAEVRKSDMGPFNSGKCSMRSSGLARSAHRLLEVRARFDMSLRRIHLDGCCRGTEWTPGLETEVSGCKEREGPAEVGDVEAGAVGADGPRPR